MDKKKDYRMDKIEKTLFIFRRDLRLEDNKGLIEALKGSKEVIPCFIFSKEQLENNPYRSDNCLQFMIECLKDLDESLKEKKSRLYLFYGKPEEVVKECIEKLQVGRIVANRDYTPYSRERDLKIEKEAKKKGVSFDLFEDLLLNMPEETVKSDGTPYSIFTPYFRNASKIEVEKPFKNTYVNYFGGTIAFAEKETFYEKIPLKPSFKVEMKGGRKEGLKVLKDLKNFKEYTELRNFPSKKGSTHLSPYLKFNVCSIREVYEAISKELGFSHDLIRSLYWRDFFTAIAFFFPYVFQGAFHKKFNALAWNEKEADFKKWCTGQTGFPLVDAGMRELNETGFMHNRVRMVVASFLTKDLRINWRKGEKYFAEKLIDYDPCVNNGNWQWAASTGCDAQPYFRIFNPWNQQVKFDPECEYIKKWVPELKAFSPKTIHEWYKGGNLCVDYPLPMVEHAEESKKTLLMYKAV